jgi:hypothetical protein
MALSSFLSSLGKKENEWFWFLPRPDPDPFSPTISTWPIRPLNMRFLLLGVDRGGKEQVYFFFEVLEGEVLPSVPGGDDQSDIPSHIGVSGKRKNGDPGKFLSDEVHHLFFLPGFSDRSSLL